MRILFFFLGLPMMLMSFFDCADVLPYVQRVDVLVDGQELVLTDEELSTLQEQLETLFEGSFTLPAFGVITPQMFEEQIQDGIYVSLKFDEIFKIDDLPFDELVFKVGPDYQGFNLARGINGVFQGRCMFVDLGGQNMQTFYEQICDLVSLKGVEESDISQNEDDENIADGKNDENENAGNENGESEESEEGAETEDFFQSKIYQEENVDVA